MGTLSPPRETGVRINVRNGSQYVRNESLSAQYDIDSIKCCHI